MTFWNVLLALAIGVPLVGMVAWIAFLIYCDSMQIQIRSIRVFPRVLPWSLAAQVRKRRLEVDLTEAEIKLADARHAKLQKTLVLEALENTRYERALTTGEPERENRTVPLTRRGDDREEKYQ